MPRSWLNGRAIGTGTLDGAYADIGNARSIRFIRSEMAARAIHHGLDEIDGATLRLRAPRRFTREVWRCIDECRSERDEPCRGIRYRSRFGDLFVNRAVFEVPTGEPQPLTVTGVEPPHEDGPFDDLVADALALLALRWDT